MEVFIEISYKRSWEVDEKTSTQKNVRLFRKLDNHALSEAIVYGPRIYDRNPTGKEYFAECHQPYVKKKSSSARYL